MANLKTDVKVVLTKYNTYQLYYYSPAGMRRRLSVGESLQDAQRQALRFSDWLMEGRDPEIELDKLRKKQLLRSITVRDFFETFMERHGNFRSRNMQTSYRNSFKNVSRCSALVNCDLGSLSRGIVVEYLNARMKQDAVSTSTVNRELAFLRILMNCAVQWDILDKNPLERLKPFREPDKRKVVLSQDQAVALIEELPETIGYMVEFAINTGFRKENIMDLRIEDIRFHDLTPTGEVDLVVKGSRKESHYLSPPAVDLLRRVIRDRKEGHVFLNPKTGKRFVSIHKSFDKAVRRLGLMVNGTKFRFHDLRHVFATWLYEAGISLDNIRTLMGHRDRATTDRYVTNDLSYAGELLKAMPRLDRSATLKQKSPISVKSGASASKLARIDKVDRRAI
ncbi:MAG: site-specific integrase [bacterium]|nr:site-specific integrase [bacterium]